MKKLAAILAVLAIMSTAVIAIDSTSCFDSDGGRNYTKYGVVKANGATWSDICGDSVTLYEGYCLNGARASEKVTCPYKCFGGECIAAGKTYHAECISNPDYYAGAVRCAQVEGAGPSQCAGDGGCAINPQHAECTGNACKLTPGLGSNRCAGDGDCVPAANPSCTISAPDAISLGSTVAVNVAYVSTLPTAHDNITLNDNQLFYFFPNAGDKIPTTTSGTLTVKLTPSLTGTGYLKAAVGRAFCSKAIQVTQTTMSIRLKPGDSITIGPRKVTLKSISPISVSPDNLPQASFEITSAETSTAANKPFVFSLLQGKSFEYWGAFVNADTVFVGAGDSGYVDISYSQSATASKPPSSNVMRFGEVLQLYGRDIRLEGVSPIATKIVLYPEADIQILDKSGKLLDEVTMDKSSPPYKYNGVVLSVIDTFVGAGDASYAQIIANDEPSSPDRAYRGVKMKPGNSGQMGNGGYTLKLVSISPIAVGSKMLPLASFAMQKAGVNVASFMLNREDNPYEKDNAGVKVLNVFVGSGDASYATVETTPALGMNSGVSLSTDKTAYPLGDTVVIFATDKGTGGISFNTCTPSFNVVDDTGTSLMLTAPGTPACDGMGTINPGETKTIGRWDQTYYVEGPKCPTTLGADSNCGGYVKANAKPGRYTIQFLDASAKIAIKDGNCPYYAPPEPGSGYVCTTTTDANGCDVPKCIKFDPKSLCADDKFDVLACSQNGLGVSYAQTPRIILPGSGTAYYDASGQFLFACSGSLPPQYLDARCAQAGSVYCRENACSGDMPPVLPELERTATMHLKTGWNLVGVPVYNAGATGGLNFDVRESDCQLGSIWAYDTAAGNYAKASDIRTARAGAGYWVKSANDCTLTATGDTALEAAGYRDGLAAGWNLVAPSYRSYPDPLGGQPCDGGSCAERAKLSEITGDCTIKAGPWKYDGRQYYKVYPTDELDPTQAYWVKVASQCTMKSAGVAPPKASCAMAVSPQTATVDTPVNVAVSYSNLPTAPTSIAIGFDVITAHANTCTGGTTGSCSGTITSNTAGTYALTVALTDDAQCGATVKFTDQAPPSPPTTGAAIAAMDNVGRALTKLFS